jgi:hypothetical protein
MRVVMRSVRIFAPIGALACAVVLGGCGTPLTVDNSTELRVRLTDFRIFPGKDQVQAGRLKIRACNVGLVAHIARVEETYLSASGAAIDLGGTPTVRPGQCLSGKLTLTPGTYKLVDTISNHQDLGDYATLVVR